MDADMREAFASLSSQIAEARDEARTAARRSTEAAISSNKVSAEFVMVKNDIGILKQDVGALKDDVVHLKHRVYGSSDLPPPAGAPIVARITEGEGTVADLTGRVMRIESDLATFKTDTKTELETQTRMLSRIEGAVVSVVKHPVVRKAAYAAGALLVLWLSNKQYELGRKLDRVEQSAEVTK